MDDASSSAAPFCDETVSTKDAPSVARCRFSLSVCRSALCAIYERVTRRSRNRSFQRSNCRRDDCCYQCWHKYPQRDDYQRVRRVLPVESSTRDISHRGREARLQEANQAGCHPARARRARSRLRNDGWPCVGKCHSGRWCAASGDRIGDREHGRGPQVCRRPSAEWEKLPDPDHADTGCCGDPNSLRRSGTIQCEWSTRRC
jgi:hypothetical protein